MRNTTRDNINKVHREHVDKLVVARDVIIDELFKRNLIDEAECKSILAKISIRITELTVIRNTMINDSYAPDKGRYKEINIGKKKGKKK
jgi:hypothetical protein